MRKNAVTISEATYKQWIDRYQNGKLVPFIGSPSSITPAKKSDITHLSPVKRASYKITGKALEQSGGLTCIVLAGGTGGRFFGYDLPEAERIKFLAPILKYKQQDWSPGSVRLCYMQHSYPHTTVDIVCGDHNAKFFEHAVLQAAKCPNAATGQLNIYAKNSIPRFNPTTDDIAAANIFADTEGLRSPAKLRQRALQAAAKNGVIGGPFYSKNGAVSMHGPGHLFALLTYMLNGRMKTDIQTNRHVVMLCSGENLGAMPNHALLGYLATESCDSLAIVSTRINDKGILVRNAKKPILCEKSQLPDGPVAQNAHYTNANTFYYKIPALCKLLKLTPKEFIRTNSSDLLHLVQEHIIQKLTPIVEIKPVFFSKTDVRYCGQFTLPANALTSLFTAIDYIWQDRSVCIYDLKTQKDVPAAQSLMGQLIDEVT